MAFRRDPRDEGLFRYRSRFRFPDDLEAQRQASRRTPRGLGWARRRDIEDVYSQESAPRRGGGRYDRTGEERYAEGLEDFEADRAYGRDPVPPWELDEGGVQFGRSAGSAAHPGPHRGRGPRSYRRSDDRIREDVCDWLTDADDVDASEIDVQVMAGAVTLTGMVDSRYAKRRAEDIADAVSGVREVQNNLRLRSAVAEPSRGDRAEERSDR